MKRILLVDDDAFVARALLPTLEQHGFSVTHAPSVAAMFHELALAMPDLLVVDVELGGENGLDAIAAMRSIWPAARPPVIVLSGHGDLPLVRRGIDCGIADYILKSEFSMDRLLARVLTLAGGDRPAAEGSAPAAPPSAGHQSPPRARSAPASAPTPAPPAAVGARPAPIAWRSRLRDSIALRAFSGAVADVIRLAGNRHTKAADLVKVINRDPALSVRIIKASNEAALSHDRAPVGDVEGAVRLLGFETIRTIAGSIGLFGRFLADETAGAHPVFCLQHALVVAGICERLAPSADHAPSFHLLGLCHLLPEMALRDAFAAEFRAIDAGVAAGAPPGEAFQRGFGSERSEVYAEAAEALGLPEDLRAVLTGALCRDGLAEDDNDPATLLPLAIAYANALLVCWSREAAVFRLPPRLAGALQARLAAIDWRRTRREALAASAGISGAMDRIGPLPPPIFTQRYHPLLRVQPPGHGAIDPFFLLLDHLSKPIDIPALPGSTEEWRSTTRCACTAMRGNAAALVERAASALASGPVGCRILLVTAETAPPSLPMIETLPAQRIPIAAVARFTE